MQHAIVQVVKNTFPPLFCRKSNVVCGCSNSFLGVREVTLGGGVCHKRAGILRSRGISPHILNCLNQIDFRALVNYLATSGGTLETVTQ